MSHLCGRRGESLLSRNFPGPDEYREDGGCSYCGSISPEAFFEAVDAGHKITPTDKSYKVYVELPNPNAGKPGCFTSANFAAAGYFILTEEEAEKIVWERARDKADKIGQYVKISQHPNFLQKKFYFQHLDREQQQRFVDLLNAGKFNLAYPGRFYVRPFFIAPPGSGAPEAPAKSSES